MIMLLVDVESISNITDINNVLNFHQWTFFVITVYLMIIAIMSLLGNTLVLCGSCKYNAIDLDEVTLVFIQNLAIADLMNVVLLEIPSIVTLFAKRWILGEVVCFITGMLVIIPQITELLIIPVISLYKLCSLVRPFATRNVTRTHARGCVIFIWFFGICYTVASAGMGQVAYFDPNYLNCAISGYRDPELVGIIIVGLIFFMGLPMVIIIVSNVMILLVASQYSTEHGGTVIPSKTALITVTAVSSLFVVTIFPVTVRISLQASQVDIPSWFYTTQVQVYYINLLCNPIIYTTTNVRFRRFIKRLVFIWVSPAIQPSLATNF